MADNEHIVDFTEPEPLVPVEAVPYEEPFLWKVELILMSKYVSDLPYNIGAEDATIFKVRAAAMERARIVKEHHDVMTLEQMMQQLPKDLDTYAAWTPPRKFKGGGAIQPPRPGMGSVQRTL